MVQARSIPAALQAFRSHGGTLRTAQALALGIHPETLYKLRDNGQLLRLARGIYRLRTRGEARNPDLALLAARTSRVAVCLISALAYHEITTQIPSVVHVAVPRGQYHRLKFTPLPVRVYRYDPKTFAEGLESHDVGGGKVRIYNVARTIADSFKFRNKVGLDVAVEALRLAHQRKKLSIRELLRYARLLRVEKVISPYLQAFQ